MNIEKQLETAVRTNHLVLVVFYADWSPHYEWIGPVLRTYEKRTIELVRVNVGEDKAIADAHNIDTIPAFLLLHKRKDRKSTRLNSSHSGQSRMPSSA